MDLNIAVDTAEKTPVCVDLGHLRIVLIQLLGY